MWFQIALFVVLNSLWVESKVEVDYAKINEYIPPNGGNILFLLGMTSPSHHAWNKVLMEALAKRRYNITALSVHIDEQPAENVHYIEMEGIHEQTNTLDLNDYSVHASQTCHMLYKTNGFQRLLQYPDDFKFHLAVHDFAAGPCLLGFLKKFNHPPLVSATAFNNPTLASELTGNPLFPSFVPHYSTCNSPDMTFFGRTYNFLMYGYEAYYRRKLVRDLDRAAKQTFGAYLPDLLDLERKSEVVLINNHPAVDYVAPLLSNVIQVGGLQVKSPKAVPDDIKHFLDTASKGAVLFSLGAHPRKWLGEDKINMFMQAFTRMPEHHFIWKYESDYIPPIPPNVRVITLESQTDILAHKNLKCFLAQSDVLNNHEATWLGVPMVGIPFSSDQHSILKKSIDDGVAVKLEISYLTEDKIIDSINSVLTNASYTKNMQKRSIKFRDRREHPLDLAIWWCEYLMRHKEAQHLRSPSMDMTHRVVHMWDLLVIWSAVGFVAALLFLYGTKVLIVMTIRERRERRGNKNKFE